MQIPKEMILKAERAVDESIRESIVLKPAQTEEEYQMLLAECERIKAENDLKWQKLEEGSQSNSK